MPESVITVSNQLGLHARAAAQLVRRAGKFQSRITLRRTDNQIAADAKSILSVLTLAAAKGVELEIGTEGADAPEALAAVVELFANNFGEIQ